MWLYTHEDLRQKLLQSCLVRRVVVKASDNGQNKYGSTENLCSCHIQDFFYEAPSIFRGLFGQLQIVWYSRNFKKSTNAKWENLPFQVLNYFRNGKTFFFFFSLFEQSLMQESLCFLKLSEKCCNALFTSGFYSDVKMLLLYHHCEVSFMPSRDGGKFWNLNNNSVVWSLFLKHGGRRAQCCGF